VVEKAHIAHGINPRVQVACYSYNRPVAGVSASLRGHQCTYAAYQFGLHTSFVGNSVGDPRHGISEYAVHDAALQFVGPEPRGQHVQEIDSSKTFIERKLSRHTNDITDFASGSIPYLDLR